MGEMNKFADFDGNLVDAFRESLEQQIRERVSKDVTEAVVAEYKLLVEQELKGLVESITVENIKRLQNMLSVRDDYNVYVKIKDEGKLKDESS